MHDSTASAPKLFRNVSSLPISSGLPRKRGERRTLLYPGSSFKRSEGRQSPICCLNLSVKSICLSFGAGCGPEMGAACSAAISHALGFVLSIPLLDFAILIFVHCEGS